MLMKYSDLGSLQLTRPIKPGGFLDPNSLVQINANKALSTMNIIAAIGDKSGFSKPISSCFHAHIVRPRLEYGLVINNLNSKTIRPLENCQNTCLHRIFVVTQPTIL